jgi:hypothetical protein
MVWFKRKSLHPVPYEWTEELWNKAFISGGRFHCLVLVRSLNKRQEWQYGARNLYATREYFGGLGHEPGSPVGHVGVKLWFDTNENPQIRRGDPLEVVGWADANEWQKTYKIPCYLGVTVKTTEASALEFEQVFHRAKANGQDFVPLWLTSHDPVAPKSDGQRVSCVQPLTSVSFQQKVSLLGKFEQDQ